MIKINITDPGTGATVRQSFRVSGTSDAPTGAQVSCTISKAPFTQSATGSVDVGGMWSVTLGTATAIPADSGYAILATLPAEGASDGVSNITVQARLPD